MKAFLGERVMREVKVASSAEEGRSEDDVKWSLWGIVGVLDGLVLFCFVEATV
jgi:hypothetical protein